MAELCCRPGGLAPPPQIASVLQQLDHESPELPREHISQSAFFAQHRFRAATASQRVQPILQASAISSDQPIGVVIGLLQSPVILSEAKDLCTVLAPFDPRALLLRCAATLFTNVWDTTVAALGRGRISPAES